MSTGALLDEHGYAIRTGLFAEAECDGVLRALAHRPAGRAGQRHLMSVPAVAAVAHDPRLVALAGGGVPFRATFFDKSAHANWLVPWHQDTALPIAAGGGDGWGPWSVKDGIRYAHAPAWALEQVVALRLHLDDSAVDNGPLRVLPGSHRLGVLSDEAVAAYAQRARAEACLVARGGVLAMRPLLIHASAKIVNDLPRRVLHIEFAPARELGGGVRLAVA